jgi:hypothetical protein
MTAWERQDKRSLQYEATALKMIEQDEARGLCISSLSGCASARNVPAIQAPVTYRSSQASVGKRSERYCNFRPRMHEDRATCFYRLIWCVLCLRFVIMHCNVSRSEQAATHKDDASLGCKTCAKCVLRC